jgi:hypothetical protein
MNRLLQLIAFAGLGLTLVPSFLVFTQIIAWSTYLTMMAAGTLLWFFTAPFGMKKSGEAN